MPFEEPMDEGDVAADYAARHNQESINKVLAGLGSGSGAEFCEWCGNSIPGKRREAYPGCTLCVQCQATKERLPGRAE